ncbi:type II CRISPR RNA-guided endonuclease Cas9 [Hydrogenimonas sp.]
MGKKILALDLGITSLGYAVLDEKVDNNYYCLDNSVIMRDAPYDIKSGESSQKKHGVYKRMRSLVEKRKKRINQVSKVFEQFGLLDFTSAKKIQTENSYKEKWKLRAEDALNRKLSHEELFAVMTHIAKHRGYKSIAMDDLLYELELELELVEPVGDEESLGDEKRQVYAALDRVERLKREFPHETIAQVIHRSVKEGKLTAYRNHDNYEKMIRREDIEHEIVTIIKKQIEYGLLDGRLDSEKFVEALKKAITEQVMPENDETLFGHCSFYPEERAAPRYSYLYDLYRLYKTLADVWIDHYELTQEDREKIVAYVENRIKHGKSIDKLTYKDVRKILALEDRCRIYGRSDEYLVKGKKTARVLMKFFFLSKIKTFAQMIRSIMDHTDAYSLFAAISEILQQEKTPKPAYNKIRSLLDAAGIEAEDKEIIALIKGYSSGTLSISHRYILDALPFFVQGKSEKEIQKILEVSLSEDYSKYPKSLKNLHLGEKNLFEEYRTSLNNHAVKSLASWVLRRVADLSWKYGVFDEIVIESARDTLPESIKKEIEKGLREKEKEIDKIVSTYKKEFPSIERKMARKIKLLESQNFTDIYTGKTINISDLFEGKADIEHILPRSLGGLSTDYNLVIAHRDSNMKKANRLPMDWLQGEKEYVNRVENLFHKHLINWKKRKNLLATSMDDVFMEIKDTKTLRATSYLEALVAENLKMFYPFPKKEHCKTGIAVRNIPGKTTSKARAILGIKSKSRDTNFHHAEDALILATLSRKWQNRLHRMLKENYGKSEDELKKIWQKYTPHIEGIEIATYVKEAFERFVSQGENSLWYKDMFGGVRSVSYWSNRKPLSASSHKETLFSGRHGIPTLRKSIYREFEGLNLVKERNKLTSESFMKEYEKEIRSKLWYSYSGNLNDPVMRAIDKKAAQIAGLIDHYVFQDAKNDKAMDERYKHELSELVLQPIVVDDKVVRKVRFVYAEYKSKVRPINRGLVENDKNMLGLFVEKGSKKLSFTRVDVNNVKELDRRFDGLKVYLNEMIYIFNDKKLIHYGCLRSFSENNQGTKYVKLFNPRFPSKPKSQPEKFAQPSGIKDVSIGSATGIIKVHLNLNGTVKSYEKFGTIPQKFEKEFLEESGYGGVEDNTHH